MTQGSISHDEFVWKNVAPDPKLSFYEIKIHVSWDFSMYREKNWINGYFSTFSSQKMAQGQFSVISLCRAKMPLTLNYILKKKILINGNEEDLNKKNNSHFRRRKVTQGDAGL